MTKHLLDFHRMDEVKNFVADNLFSWCFEVAYWIHATVSHILGSRASKKGTVTTKQVQLGIGVRVQL